MDKPQKKITFSKKFFILGIIILLLIVGTIVPFSMSDGSEKFSGVNKNVAKYSIDIAWDRARGIDYSSIFGTIKITAASIKEDTANSTKTCNGDFTDNTPGGAKSYFAKVEYRSLFGVVIDTATFRICRSHD